MQALDREQCAFEFREPLIEVLGSQGPAKDQQHRRVFIDSKSGAATCAVAVKHAAAYRIAGEHDARGRAACSRRMSPTLG